MNTLDTKDLQMVGALVSESRGFLMARDDGECIMDSETIEKLEIICIGLTIVGESLACSGVWTKEQIKKAAVEKMIFLSAGEHIEDVIFDALRKNRDLAMKKIRSEQEEGHKMSMSDIVKRIMKDEEVKSEASNNQD